MLTPYERLALFRFDFFVRLNSLMAQDESESLENQILALDKVVFSTRLHPLMVLKLFRNVVFFNSIEMS